MFDFSWTELALIGVVALVVIGPKDLPKALRTAGVWVRKARNISREFQSSVEQMMRESELDEVKKQIESVSTMNFAKEIEKAVDPTGDLAESLKPPEMPDFNQMMNEETEPIAPGVESPPTTTPPLAAIEGPPATLKLEGPKTDAPTPETVMTEPVTPEPVKPDSIKPDPVKPVSAP
jgi:sec-independent protein translocase protein TatB